MTAESSSERERLAPLTPGTIITRQLGETVGAIVAAIITAVLITAFIWLFSTIGGEPIHFFAITKRICSILIGIVLTAELAAFLVILHLSRRRRVRFRIMWEAFAYKLMKEPSFKRWSPEGLERMVELRRTGDGLLGKLSSTS